MTVIERPVRIRTLVSATKAALSARRRQYETRNLVHKLEQSVRDRDQFLAMLGHELRNPLAAILTASALMHRRAGQPLREQAIVSRQSRHLARLVDDLLEVARVTSGKIVLHRVAFDLTKSRSAVSLPCSPPRAQQGVEIGLHSDSAPLLLVADPVRVEQVLTNLVGNGIKYTPSGGRIDVEVLASGTTPSSACATPARASTPASCPASSTSSSRGRTRWTAPRAAWASGSRSCSGWCGCTAARCGPRATGRARAANSRCACRCTPARPTSPSPRRQDRPRAAPCSWWRTTPIPARRCRSRSSTWGIG